MNKVFPNAKPILLGSGEDSIGIIDTPAVAGLTGDNTQAAESFGDDMTIIDHSYYNDTDKSADSTSNLTIGDGETVVSSTTINITKPVNKLIIETFSVATGSFTDTKQVRLRRGGLTGSEEFFNNSSGMVNPIDINLTFTDLPLGSIEFVVTVNVSNGNLTTNFYNNLPGRVIFTETDQATLTGSDTHASTITTPATATKQINSPDTHRTRESEIIS